MVDQTQKRIYLLPYTIYSYKNKKECNEWNSSLSEFISWVCGTFLPDHCKTNEICCVQMTLKNAVWDFNSFFLLNSIVSYLSFILTFKVFIFLAILSSTLIKGLRVWHLKFCSHQDANIRFP
jgi:hypothetical protein